MYQGWDSTEFSFFNLTLNAGLISKVYRKFSFNFGENKFYFVVEQYVLDRVTQLYDYDNKNSFTTMMVPTYIVYS